MNKSNIFANEVLLKSVNQKKLYNKKTRKIC